MAIDLVAPRLGGIFLTPGPYCLHSPAPADKCYKSSEELRVDFAMKSSASSFICRAFDGVWPGWVLRTPAGAVFLELLVQAINTSLAAEPRRCDVIIGYFKSAGAEWRGNEPNCRADDIAPTSALPGVS